MYLLDAMYHYIKFLVVWYFKCISLSSKSRKGFSFNMRASLSISLGMWQNLNLPPRTSKYEISYGCFKSHCNFLDLIRIEFLKSCAWPIIQITVQDDWGSTLYSNHPLITSSKLVKTWMMHFPLYYDDHSKSCNVRAAREATKKTFLQDWMGGKNLKLCLCVCDICGLFFVWK